QPRQSQVQRRHPHLAEAPPAPDPRPRPDDRQEGALTVDLSIVVPLYNEEESVDALYDEIRAAADDLGLEWELLLVDDGSPYGTRGLLRPLGVRAPRVTALRFRRNFGQTAALQAGFDHTTGRVVVTLDGDLQNDPRDFGLLLATLAEGYDVVCGWRRHREDA